MVIVGRDGIVCLSVRSVLHSLVSSIQFLCLDLHCRIGMHVVNLIYAIIPSDCLTIGSVLVLNLIVRLYHTTH